MRHNLTIPQKNLLEYRLKNSFTQSQMAEKLGLESQQMYDYHEKVKLTDGKVLKFSEILGVNLFEGASQVKQDMVKLRLPSVVQPESVDLSRIEATIKVLIHRLAKYEARATNKPVMDCKKEIEEDIQLVLG